MIELKAYKTPLRLSIFKEDIKGIREIFDSRKQIRKHTQIFIYNDWVSIEGKYEDIKSQINIENKPIGYR